MSLKKMNSGIEYSDDVEGTGKEIGTMPVTAQVHYTGWLKNPDGSKGTKFDSSVDRNDPITFPIGAGYVIQGWDLGLQGMKEGGKRTLYIPSHLGYGSHGAGDVIPPDADLIFEVEILKLLD